MRLLLTGFALGMLLTGAATIAQPQFLHGSELRDTISGHTLIAGGWAEYYAPDGQIHGRARMMGTRAYVGRWVAHSNRICYDYEGTAFDTCSQLRLLEGKVAHHDLDGKLKADGVARRLSGNRLSEF